MTPFRLLLLLFCTGALSAQAAPREPGPHLSETYAAFRALQVENVAYELAVDLSESKDEFSGRVAIRFDLRAAGEPLTVDFTGGEVRQVALNGEPVEFDYNGFFVTVDTANLTIGPHELTIEYSHPYSRDGAGLYRFEDSEDGRVYVYTDFEPYDANRLFPCFDQPDLKASYTVDVTAPADWLVSTSVRESEVEEAPGGKRWRFPKSAVFSTYIFPLHAGPFQVWEGAAGEIPLRLMARRSLAKYVQPADWFEPTRRGFEFFQDYFDIDYPYGKYDQLIVPDFNAGAMENVAAVTFSERYIKRGEYTQEDRDRIDNVILHEMAHMWFGNLVTMRWWNGLWLNESFASYMSYLAAAGADPASRWWLRFFLRLKEWAYTTDEQVTTHPIELPVYDTGSAFANFDGITYGKGAATLKQVSYLLGADRFRAGVSDYLKQRAGGNSELEDFIGALAAAGEHSLKRWSRQWLYGQGLNSVAAEPVCEDDELSRLSVQQSTGEFGAPLREHRFEVATYRVPDDGAAEIAARFDASIDGATAEVNAPEGTPCPDLVYVNFNDHAFFKVQLSDAEMALLERRIHAFEAPLQRAMLWRVLWEGVRDGRLPLPRYADALLAQIAAEQDPNILLRILRTVRHTLAYYFAFARADDAAAFAARFNDIAWARLTDVPAGGDVQKFWFDALVTNTLSESAQAALAELLRGAREIDGLDLESDQDRRWRIIQRLSALGYRDAAHLAKTERARDPSDSGAKAHLGADVLGADQAGRDDWLEVLQGDGGDLSLAEQKVVMNSLFLTHRPDIAMRMQPAVLGALPALIDERESLWLRYYGGALIRGGCDADREGALLAALDDNPAAPVILQKTLRIAIQEDARCMNIKRVAGFDSPPERG